MTNRDYVALAKELSQIPISRSRAMCINAVARVLARDNPRFDVRKFQDVCGVAYGTKPCAE